MSSKFNPSRPAGKKPPICKGKKAPAPDATPAETIPIISGLPITIAISWFEVSPQRPWSIKRTFYVPGAPPDQWRIRNYQQDNVIMNLTFTFFQSSGTWTVGGSIRVDQILEDTIQQTTFDYTGGQPFRITMRPMANTHNPTPTPASVSFGAVLQ